jgi:hypothetical protein
MMENATCRESSADSGAEGTPEIQPGLPSGRATNAEAGALCGRGYKLTEGHYGLVG